MFDLLFDSFNNFYVYTIYIFFNFISGKMKVNRGKILYLTENSLDEVSQFRKIRLTIFFPPTSNRSGSIVIAKNPTKFFEI